MLASNLILKPDPINLTSSSPKRLKARKKEKLDGKGNKIEALVCDCDSLINLAAGMGRTPGIYIAPPSTQPRTQPSPEQRFFHQV